MNNRPYLYVWYSLVFFMSSILVTVTTIVGLVTVEKDPSGFWILGIPFIVFWLVQLAVIGFLGWLLLGQIKKWNTFAMFASAFIVPIVSMVMIVVATEKVGRPINGVGDPTPFYLIAGLYIISGILLYNDIKYRKPKGRVTV